LLARLISRCRFLDFSTRYFGWGDYVDGMRVVGGADCEAMRLKRTG
jgi:hypothetical protein